MRRDTGTTTSVWLDHRPPELAPLQADQETEVCVIGAGIAGLTTAYLLGRKGKAVTVLEDGSVGGGETGRTTAHLSTALDDRYFELEKVRGKDVSSAAAQSHSGAISMIENIIADEAIDCEFRRLDGYLFTPPKRSPRPLKKELAAAHRAGLGDVELIDRAPLPSFDTGPCLRFPRQALFHPMKYLLGLAAAIRRDGGQIFSGAHVANVEGGSTVRIHTTSQRVVTAKA